MHPNNRCSAAVRAVRDTMSRVTAFASPAPRARGLVHAAMSQPSQPNASGGGGGFAQNPRQDMEYICAGNVPAHPGNTAFSDGAQRLRRQE